VDLKEERGVDIVSNESHIEEVMMYSLRIDFVFIADDGDTNDHEWFFKSFEEFERIYEDVEVNSIFVLAADFSREKKEYPIRGRVFWLDEGLARERKFFEWSYEEVLEFVNEAKEELPAFLAIVIEKSLFEVEKDDNGEIMHQILKEQKDIKVIRGEISEEEEEEEIYSLQDIAIRKNDLALIQTRLSDLIIAIQNFSEEGTDQAKAEALIVTSYLIAAIVNSDTIDQEM